MPYRKNGFVIVPRSMYLPQMAGELMTSLGATFDVDIAKMIKSLGNERILLKNFFFERLLQVDHPKLADSSMKLAFIVLLADFLRQTGYITESPNLVDYVIDPVLPADDLISLMLGSRMPTYAAADLGGEWASIDTLTQFFPEVIRRYALVLAERPLLEDRFRLWLGHIGWRLMVGGGELSQAERSFLTVYGCTKKRTKGYLSSRASKPIPAQENKNILVTEAGALATAVCLSGPCVNHMKLISNQILEQVTFYYGPHVPDLKSFIGFERPYGPFTSFILTPEDSIPWLLDSQITGITSSAANVSVKPANQPPWSLRPPFADIMKVAGAGAIAAYPDLPEMRLWLTDPNDISHFTWDYPSKWRGRRINSLTEAGTMDYALADAAVNVKTGGGMQTEMTDLSNVGIAWFTPKAEAKISQNDNGIFEQYVLPGPKGLINREVDMTAYYSRMGRIELKPAFCEYLQLPLSWFLTPAEAVVDFVSSTQGLTIQERVRFTQVIAICHNCARYFRMTGRIAPIQRDALIKSLLNVKAQIIPTA
jgi:hypothetical protein